MHIEINRDIVKRINAGDIKAFEQMYDTYYEYLCGVATMYVFDVSVAQEIANDVFLNVWDKRETLLFPVKPYLRKAVQNRSLNYIRSVHDQETSLLDGDDEMLEFFEHFTSAGDPLEILENKDAELAIRQAIDALPEKCRLLFERNLYYNQSYEEIAREYGLSVSTVRVQMKIALTKLREALKDIRF